MLALELTTQFKRDFKREKAGHHTDLDEVLKNVTNLLVAKASLPAALNDHPLKGKWKGARDCHLKPDLVLIYRRTTAAVQLVRLGSHSELFS